MLGTNHELVAADFDHGAFKQLLRTLSGDGRLAAGSHLDVIGAGDLDLLEIADLIIARDRRAGAFAVALAAGRSGGGSGNHGRGDGLAHGSSCDAVLLRQYTPAVAAARQKERALP